MRPLLPFLGPCLRVCKLCAKDEIPDMRAHGALGKFKLGKEGHIPLQLKT